MIPAKCPTKLACGTMMDVNTRDSKGAKLIGRDNNPKRSNFDEGCFAESIVIQPKTTHE
jgi:ssDNA-binding Zn-finger/Zn-ribbon topoisomerase 1